MPKFENFYLAIYVTFGIMGLSAAALLYFLWSLVSLLFVAN